MTASRRFKRTWCAIGNVAGIEESGRYVCRNVEAGEGWEGTWKDKTLESGGPYSCLLGLYHWTIHLGRILFSQFH